MKKGDNKKMEFKTEKLTKKELNQYQKIKENFSEKEVQRFEKIMVQKWQQEERLANKIRSNEKSKREKRNHRIYTIGGIVEKYCGEITDLDAFEKYINKYAKSINSFIEKDQNAEQEKPQNQGFSSDKYVDY